MRYEGEERGHCEGEGRAGGGGFHLRPAKQHPCIKEYFNTAKFSLKFSISIPPKVICIRVSVYFMIRYTLFESQFYILCYFFVSLNFKCV